MTDQEKLIEKFLYDKLHITIDDCDRLLIAFGFDLRRSGGSHRIYHKRNDIPVTVVAPKNTKYVKPAYVNLIIKRFNLEV